VAQTAQQRIAELEAQLAERDAEIAELKSKLETAVARIAELEAKVNQNSSNSSRPPSSDPPWADRPRPNPRNKGKRPRGGQKGHEGHRRELVPPEQVRNTCDVHPEHCGCCGSTDLVDDGSEPVRHQVTDLPPVVPFTDEWRLYNGVCGTCGATTRAALPAGVPRSNFGPVLTALVALLTAVYKVGKRGVQDLLSDVFGVVMSLGAVSNCERQASEAVAEPVEAAHQYAQDQAIANADETSWKECAKKVWLWVMATANVTVFFILPGRGAECARFVLGRFKGILVSDRYKGYLFYSMGLRQICWAHYADLRIMPTLGEMTVLCGAITASRSA
jgi:transposase